MQRKLETILFNHWFLVCFYMISILFVLSPTHFYGGMMHRMIEGIYVVWTMTIVMYDLRKKRIRWDPLLIALYFLIIWAGVSYAVQPKGHGIYELIHLFTLVLMVHVVFTAPSFLSDVQTERAVTVIGRLVIIAVVLLNSVSIIYYYLHDIVVFPSWMVTRLHCYTERHGILRYAGIYYHPVLGGEKLIASIVFSLMLMERKRLSLLLGFIALISSGVMLYLGNSRTAFLQLVVIVLFLAGKITSSNKKAFQLFIMGTILCAVIAVIAVCWIKMPDGITYESLNYMSSNRLKLWTTAFQEFLRRPWLGWGWENGDAVAPYTGSDLHDCHNVIFNLLLWTGIPGIASFICAIVFWILGLKLNNSDPWYVLIVVLFLMQSMLDPLLFGEDIRIGTPLFWLFAGIVYYQNQNKNTINLQVSSAPLSIDQQ